MTRLATKLNRSKKGVFLALGLTFLALVLLSLGILVLNYSTSDEDTVVTLNIVDRVYELKSSIERGFFQIFNAKSGIIVNITNQTIEFKENLPNANNGSFSAQMTSFEDFVERNFPNVAIEIVEIKKEVPLIITPSNVTYRHKDFGGKEIRIEGKGMLSYKITVIISENVTGCTIEDFDPGNTNLTIFAFGTFGTNCMASQLVDPSRDTEIEIDGVGGENISIDLNNNIMKIKAKGSATVHSVLGFNTTQQLHIEYPEALNIDYPDFGVNLKTAIRII